MSKWSLCPERVNFNPEKQQDLKRVPQMPSDMGHASSSQRAGGKAAGNQEGRAAERKTLRDSKPERDPRAQASAGQARYVGPRALAAGTAGSARRGSIEEKRTMTEENRLPAGSCRACACDRGSNSLCVGPGCWRAGQHHPATGQRRMFSSWQIEASGENLSQTLTSQRVLEHTHEAHVQNKGERWNQSCPEHTLHQSMLLLYIFVPLLSPLLPI
jgi:hypothetical protein